MIALDTNLLVFAHRRGTVEHDLARRAIERAAAEREGFGVPLPCLSEFWRVVTHPGGRGRASSPAEARAFEIWTHDRGFLAVPGLAVLDPLAPAASSAE